MNYITMDDLSERCRRQITEFRIEFYRRKNWDRKFLQTYNPHQGGFLPVIRERADFDDEIIVFAIPDHKNDFQIAFVLMEEHEEFLEDQSEGLRVVAE